MAGGAVKNKIILLLLLIIQILLLSGCVKPERPQDSRMRIVIASPEVAEIVTHLGAGDLIVGVTRECDYPADLRHKNQIGTFGKIDMEKVVSLEPDIVFVSGLEQEFMAQELAKLSIRVEKIYPSSLDEMLQSITGIGEILGKQEAAKVLTDSLKLMIRDYKKSLPGNKPRLYVEIYGNPVMSISDGSYIGELVELAGFDNVFGELPRDYSRISPEAVLAADPEYILLLYPGISAEQVSSRKGWSQVSAVRNNRVFAAAEIDADLFVRATPRSLKGVRKLRALLEAEDD
jgi:iron complex transport system substrate-binding protein